MKCTTGEHQRRAKQFVCGTCQIHPRDSERIQLLDTEQVFASIYWLGGIQNHVKLGTHPAGVPEGIVAVKVSRLTEEKLSAEP